jgi:hypothetical protein
LKVLDTTTLANGALAPLPVGSHLDADSGEFVWAPPPAFGGTHDLVFMRTTGAGSERIDVRVTIVPARRDHHFRQ